MRSNEFEFLKGWFKIDNIEDWVKARITCHPDNILLAVEDACESFGEFILSDGWQPHPQYPGYWGKLEFRNGQEITTKLASEELYQLFLTSKNK